MKIIILLIFLMSTAGCATLTNNAMTPIELSFSDGSKGQCQLQNKRGTWEVPIPLTYSVRRSDDPLKYDCRTLDDRAASGSMPSTIGRKFTLSALFIDFGFTDSITDKHREYPSSYVIPIEENE